MTTAIPDLRHTRYGISSPSSPSSPSAAGAGYSCAFPSWPNRPSLHQEQEREQAQRPIVRSRQSSSISHRSFNAPDAKFLEDLRRRVRPEECIVDEEDEEDDDCAVSESVFTSVSSTTTSPGLTGVVKALPGARRTLGAPRCDSNSLLTRGLMEMNLGRYRSA